MEILKAKVEKLFVTQPLGVAPVAIEKMEVLLEGIKYDRHFGKTRLSDVRTTKLLPKGFEVTNLRGATLVSLEELHEVSKEIGVAVLPEDLEANIVLSGVEGLTKLPAGTFVKFPRNAILFVTGENLPCVILARNMMKRGIANNIATSVVKAAMGKRGLTAMPFASGFIKVGDEVEICKPQNFE